MEELDDDRYRRVSFQDLPGWADDDHLAAFRAFGGSAVGLFAGDGGMRKPLTGLAHEAYSSQGAVRTRGAARAFFEENFVPHRVVHDDGPGLLTGYYEPVIDGSLTPVGAFTVPLYKRPADLENVVGEAERSAAAGGFSHMRRTADGLEPYATREEIESGALAGQGLEVIYLSDPVAAFFLHVQGSGAIRLPDGTIRRVTYDGKNGHPYTSVGRTLIEDGSFARADVTLQSMTEWLNADLERARRVLWRNKSFVFFRFLDADAPIGVLGTPLVALRSLAVDPAFHALGSPVYVSAPAILYDGTAFNRLMVAHDVGSAIKGPERGDIFFGTGEDGLKWAGVTKHPGTFFVLLPGRAT